MKIERNNIVSRTNQRKKELLPVRTKLSHKETFFRKGIRNKMRKADVFINGPVYLDLPILEISKTLTHEFYYGYQNQNMEKNKNMLHGYRLFHGSNKNRRYLFAHWKINQSRTWHFKY